MDILFCDPLRMGELRGLYAHIYEVSSNLTRLGHNLKLLKVIKPDKKRLPLWVRIDRLSYRLPVIGTIISEAYTFILIFFAIVKHRAGFDVIYRRHNALNSEYLLSRLFGIPLVKEVNGLEAEPREDGDNSSWRAGILNRVERFTIAKADRLIVVTLKLKKTLYLDYGIPDEKIVVIENGANTELFKPIDAVKARKKLNLEPGNLYICLVGSNLLSYQGTGRLIRAAPFILERFPDARFLIVGGTSDSVRKELIDSIERAGLGGNFIFTGLLLYEQVPLYINASDVCVVLPKVFERKAGSSPLRLCEYMACGKPVVASRTAGHENLEKNNSGLLVDSESPQQIANAINSLLDNKELRTDMGRSGRRYVVENRSWHKVAQRTAQVCKEAAERYP